MSEGEFILKTSTACLATYKDSIELSWTYFSRNKNRKGPTFWAPQSLFLFISKKKISFYDKSRYPAL